MKEEERIFRGGSELLCPDVGHGPTKMGADEGYR